MSSDIFHHIVQPFLGKDARDAHDGLGKLLRADAQVDAPQREAEVYAQEGQRHGHAPDGDGVQY